MKKHFLLIVSLISIQSIIAQVGINTTTPSNSSMLDINANNAGVLIPRLDIIDLTTQAPVTGTIEESLLAYNTNATTGKGFYYWDGTEWVKLQTGTGGGGGAIFNGWETTGNAGTNPATNFLGTTNNRDLVIRTNDTERIRISADGRAGLAIAPEDETALRVANFPVGIHTSTTDGEGTALFAEQSSIEGSAITALGLDIGIYSESSGTGDTAIGITAVAMYGESIGENNATGGFFESNAGNSIFLPNIGLIGSSANGGDAYVAPFGESIGIHAYGRDIGLTSIVGRPINAPANSGFNIYAGSFAANFTGDPAIPDDRDQSAFLAGVERNAAGITPNRDVFYGGAFFSGQAMTNAAFAYAGARHNNTNYKIIGNGAVSTIVNDTSGDEDKKRIMFASEAPEVLFEDYGVGKLENGEITISIDPIFTRNITVNHKHPLKVFIQLEGECNGVFVTNKRASSFTVKELNNGTSNVSFSWHIIGNRKDETSSKYENLRYPFAPKAPKKMGRRKMKSPSKKNRR